jgi:hypothetical protein
MNYRLNELYKDLTVYVACSIVEGFSGEENTEEEILTAWQWLVDTGHCWELQGWYGRNASALVECGTIQPPLDSHRDYYGNEVPGTNAK